MKYTEVTYIMYDFDLDDNITTRVCFRGHNLTDAEALDYFARVFNDCELIDFDIKRKGGMKK